MASAEVRIAADKSGEPVLVDNVMNDSDMHSFLATDTFRIITGDDNLVVSKSIEPYVTSSGITVVPNDLRDAHKAVTFAKFYKATAGTVLYHTS